VPQELLKIAEYEVNAIVWIEKCNDGNYAHALLACLALINMNEQLILFSVFRVCLTCFIIFCN